MSSPSTDCEVPQLLTRVTNQIYKLFALLLDNTEPFWVDILDGLYKVLVAVVVNFFLLLRCVGYAHVVRLIFGVRFEQSVNVHLDLLVSVYFHGELKIAQYF